MFRIYSNNNYCYSLYNNTYSDLLDLEKYMLYDSQIPVKNYYYSQPSICFRDFSMFCDEYQNVNYFNCYRNTCFKCCNNTIFPPGYGFNDTVQSKLDNMLNPVLSIKEAILYCKFDVTKRYMSEKKTLHRMTKGKQKGYPFVAELKTRAKSLLENGLCLDWPVLDIMVLLARLQLQKKSYIVPEYNNISEEYNISLESLIKSEVRLYQSKCGIINN